MSTSTLAVAQQRWAINPGALQPLVQSYVGHLVALRYRDTTIHRLETRARHFCYWLNQSAIAVAQIDDSVINQFARHSCQCPGYRASDTLSKAYVGGVLQFVSLLGQSQVVHLPARATDDGRIQAYLDWLRQHRDLSENTIEVRRKLVNKRKVSLWLGHATMQSTEIYLRADPTEKLDALAMGIPPTLKRGKFQVPDKLIAMFKEIGRPV